jgi:hypothetical protein
MLPDDWRHEIDEAISKATAAAAVIAESYRREENRGIAASIDALTCQLKRYNAEQVRDAPNKRARENKTIYALIAAAFFSFALAGFSAWQVIETRRAYGPIKTAADAAVKSAEAAGASAVAGQKTAETAALNVDVLINSERARMLVGSMTLVKNGDADPAPHVDYTWINFGRGPAVVTDVLIDCQLVPTTIPASPLEESSKTKHGQFTIGSGSLAGTSGMAEPLKPCTFDTPITPNDWAAIGLGTKFILVQGFLNYEDAFRRYKWHFGGVYYGNAKSFSTFGLPEAYNHETQESQAR